MIHNNFRNDLINGVTKFGTWTMLPSSFVVDVIAQTNIDFVIIDMEHGTITFETAEEMVRAAQLYGCQPIIRVGNDLENTILHALETNCHAIMIPHVSNAQTAEKIVQYCKYYPEGKRGMSPYTRCHNYTHEFFVETIKENNEKTLVGVLVEGIEGIKNLNEISKTIGIDLIYLGMYDISQSVGFPGQLEHPEVVKQVDICLKIILANGKVAGTFARDIKSAKKFKDIGFGFVAFVADSYAIHKFYTDCVVEFNQ